MGALQIKEKIDLYFKQFNDKEKEKKEGEIKFTPTKDNMYRLGKLLLNNVPEILETRESKFQYVSWKWYVYVLRKIDKDSTFWVSYTDQFRIETTLLFNGKEYKFSYGVCESAISSKNGKPLNTISEMYINEGMRCYAKNASVNTGLFFNLWIEGGNL